MPIFGELAIIFAICLVGDGIVSLFPFAFPSSVVSLILLIILLLTGVIKEGYIKKIADFFSAHMSILFLPSCIGILQYADLILPQLVPFAIITALTTPVVYFVSGWTVQLMLRHTEKKEDSSHD